MRLGGHNEVISYMRNGVGDPVSGHFGSGLLLGVGMAMTGGVRGLANGNGFGTISLSCGRHGVTDNVRIGGGGGGGVGLCQ